jgi:two-component system sensor histidine kinase/response regulator
MFNTLVQILSGKPHGAGAEEQEVSPTVANLAAIKGAVVLLVEDNEFNQQIARELLTDAGFVVDVAADGQKSLEMLAKRTYDVVLMDMQMPVMDGVAATVEIRKQDAFRELPVIAMTANVMEADIKKCADVGMNDHVGKPIDPDELFGRLLKWVKPTQPAPTQPNLAAAVNLTGAEAPAGTPPGPAPDRQNPPDELPVIPGLDTGLGLKRLMGKKSFYLEMLQVYLEDQGEAPAQIRRSLDAGDYATAERVAHTAKGVSGNIGATEIQALAARVEKAIHGHESREAVEELIVPLATAHAKLIAGLKEALPAPRAEEVPVADGTPVDREQAAAAVKKLANLLTNYDSEASDLLGTAGDLFRGFLGAAPFQAIQKAVKDFDFEKALSLLRDEVKKCGIDL